MLCNGNSCNPSRLFFFLSLFVFLVRNVWYLDVEGDLINEGIDKPTPSRIEKNYLHKVNNTIRIPRNTPAFVYLGNEEHLSVRELRDDRPNCRSVYESLWSLASHFPSAKNNISANSSFPEPVVIILHENELTNFTRHALTYFSPFPIYFHEIVYEQPRDRKWENVTIKFEGLPYLRMCAFWFHYIFELEFLPDYIMRLDTDSCLTSNMKINPFQYMYENNVEYMYHSTFGESHDLIEELKDFVIQHPGQHVNRTLSMWRDGHEMEVFSTNLEWMYVPAFRRPDVVAWYDKVGRNGGVFRNRWGDAPLRTVVVAMFFNSSKVSRFCNFSYNHSFWDPLKECLGKAGDPYVNKFGWNMVYMNVTSGESVLA